MINTIFMHVLPTILAVTTDVPFEQSDFAIETKTFMLRYGIFILAGFLSAFGTLGFQSYKNAQTFAKHLITSMVTTLAIGIILFELMGFSVTVVFAIALILGLFLKYIIDMVIQIIGKLPTYSDKVADKVTDDISDKISDKIDGGDDVKEA